MPVCEIIKSVPKTTPFGTVSYHYNNENQTIDIYDFSGYFLGISNLAAQDSGIGDPTGCEDNEARLDNILSVVEKQNDPAYVLIIIARLGESEKSLEISHLRLHNAKEYLLIRPASPMIPRNRIITAIGDRTSGFGRVEFYFGGKLIEQLLVEKNKTEL